MQGKDWPLRGMSQSCLLRRARPPDALATRAGARTRDEEDTHLPWPHPSSTWSPPALSIYFNLVKALGFMDMRVPSSSFPCVRIT